MTRKLYPNRCVCTCPAGATINSNTGACALDPAILACYKTKPKFCAGGTVTAGEPSCTCDCVNGQIFDYATDTCIQPTVARCAKQNEARSRPFTSACLLARATV